MNKAKLLRVGYKIVVSCWLLVASCFSAYAQQDTLIELQQAKANYIKDKKFNECVDYLKSLASKNKASEWPIDYYIALTRYEQLKHLEDTQSWDEYFAQGNVYRDEIVEYSKRVIFNTAPSDLLHIKSRLLAWQFHRAQQDAFHEQALEDLMADLAAFTQATKDALPIKDIADTVLSYGEKAKARELYRLYAQKLISSEIKDADLKASADSFFKEGNLALAQTLYNAYLERIAKAPVEKDKFVPMLINLAKDFMYKDKGEFDSDYAEKLFVKAESIGGKGIFDQELIYLRAFNLEKAKDYPKAKEIYGALLERFPSSGNADEAEFKCGLILTYILRDASGGKAIFEKLKQKEAVSPQVVSSLYQLGLLSQWEENIPKAKELFNEALKKSGVNFPETVFLAKERLKEIEAEKPIEHSLKTFLDLSLKQEFALYDMSKSEIHARSYRGKINDPVNVSTAVSTSPSGCMQVETQYLWSGNLGKELPELEKSSFDTSYAHPGTKEVFLVVVQPSGIVDRNMDMVDVY